ncbi:MAG: isocitrate/isopropylmalate dehydrogenase family protein [Thaumarchaeota archaeon]|nr:isocitrate/isopropylmalate dehydrogenase family protein [Candidatus Calditenuaceae archaeon]MDW8041425.1 isocitrate/isopropylmalate dehydrogenase family protein [Nitrososphaerota archaeon]
MSRTKSVVLIKGDGTGPELTEATLLVLDKINPGIEVLVKDAGYDWWISAGKPKTPALIPDDTWEAILNSDACLKAPTTTPPDPDAPKSVAVSIRQRMDLYANVRPIKTFKGLPGPLGDVDFVCVREATEGLYIGIEFMISPGTAVALRRISDSSSERVARYAFEEAQRRGFRKVIAVTKRNILRLTDTVFFNAVQRVASRYPDIALEEYYIDNMAQQLVKNPQRFNNNVILSTNLFMDVLSELASALVANIGMIYSANFGDRYAMFEPAHGSAPKYKGQYRVNPTAMLLSAAWMLEYLGFKREGVAIFKALEDVVAERKRVTYDLGGNASMLEMAEAVAARAEQILMETG